jgi:hypothetical protein
MQILFTYTSSSQQKAAEKGFGYYVHSADKRMLSYIQ